MTSLVRTTPPAEEPVTLSEVKAHLRIDSADEDALLATYISAVVAFLDGPFGLLGRTMITQTWTMRAGLGVFLDSRKLRMALFPFFNVSAVAASYRDETGDWVAIPTESLEIAEHVGTRGTDAVWRGATFPELYEDEALPFSFVITTGQARSALHASIKAAIFLLVGDLYRDREASTMQPMRVNSTVDALLANERRKTSIL